MMLIDTHILLWIVGGMTGRMGTKTVELVRHTNPSDFEVSVASLFEIKLKQRKGKLQEFNIQELLQIMNSRSINLIEIGAQTIESLPGVDLVDHADPFDLILVAQAVAGNSPLLTCDEKILEFDVPGFRLIDGRK